MFKDQAEAGLSSCWLMSVSLGDRGDDGTRGLKGHLRFCHLNCAV